MARRVALAGCMGFIALFMFCAAFVDHNRVNSELYLVIGVLYVSVLIYTILVKVED